MSTLDKSTPEITPITVFTGFLGSGKTTLILKIVKQLPKNYKVALLKNEFGDVETDSALAQESSLQVTEMNNGCLCCVLIGQMKNALIEIKEKYAPDRIIVETSGSAFPAPIAWQIRQMKDDLFELDSIMTVIDCENFMGYEDTSFTAKLQAQYTDLILLNKVDELSERQIDLVIDHVDELNTDTPKIKVFKDKPIPIDLVFGIDTQLFQIINGDITFPDNTEPYTDHHDTDHHSKEIDVIQVHVLKDSPKIETDDSNQSKDNLIPLQKNDGYYYNDLKKFFQLLPPEDVYRLKGVVKLLDKRLDLLNCPELICPEKSDSSINDTETSTTCNDSNLYIVNFAYKRFTLTRVTKQNLLDTLSNNICKLVIMGVNLRMYQKIIIDSLNLRPSQISATWAE
ncbi:hypothetical protein BB561_004161 [Smittium simulii]|uniref:CobW/HypB/UreG nucleotide-binding domain-containing protein n=1 Tax=Smittium simulii TaxID=133385 RepID=A0A2T9YHT9_9FUNG|nr:hypothetical protein BB561_004161 [Smittium simulii]